MEDFADEVVTEMTADEKQQFNEAWTPKLYAGGWICATWPEEYGGKGLSTMESVVVAEEFHRAGAPMRADFFGDTLVGPTIQMQAALVDPGMNSRVVPVTCDWSFGLLMPCR
mgnify:CR=1 FL=1